MASETADMASQIEQKKRELARIEQKRVELELAKAQAQLQQQERELLELQNKLALAASAPPAVVNPAVQVYNYFALVTLYAFVLHNVVPLVSYW